VFLVSAAGEAVSVTRLVVAVDPVEVEHAVRQKPTTTTSISRTPNT
jgi:hypothetical protein